ncbi:hypothetical protein SAMN02910432_00243 [Ligilactobacillus ruminis DSM 20403 = NBRC 102161]|uniref:Uncharacterized protein n=2 Tax=Ligilactobacillus ruminis TaxID=1623 RepID=A0A837IS98_9LACO|nr:hypothetical protein LRB_869 [Ligilactobacillus ruminis]SFG18168.1 hypothetical protein SAMN02910432_00243 [Ligilactobacillus ruminis DSM 20403 = NBRC 102161]
MKSCLLVIQDYGRKKHQCVADFDCFKSFSSEVLLALVKIVYTVIKHIDQGGPFFMANQACIEK